ncbi:MAG: HEAT repeat domain-containing protein [Terriglobia bacterium]
MSNSVSSEAVTGRERRLSGSIIFGVPIVLIAVTFLFWYQTWFGRRLTQAELSEYLKDTSLPHQTQHALTQAAAEILRHDPNVERVYPQIIALASNNEAGFRSMAAWVMGQDNRSADFHQALLKLIDDPEPMVRWNAALALARFGDAAGEPQLKLMLHPYEIHTPVAGTVSLVVNSQDTVRNGSVVARIKAANSDPVEIRSPLAGAIDRIAVKDGAIISAGDEIAVISPEEQQVWEALRALDLVGRPDDLADVDSLSRPVGGMSDRVRQQAALTAAAIRKRALKEQLKVESGNFQ